MNNKRLAALSSPSGGGKTTVARHILRTFKNFRFSVSATTRPIRPREIDGKDYFFLKRTDFERKIKNNELVEYEEIYGNYYGTLKSEIEKILATGSHLLFDVDVRGALSLQKAYPNNTCLIFLAPPSLRELELRLRKRSTETDEQIARRMAGSEMELSEALKFDHIIVNAILKETLASVEKVIRQNFKYV